MAARPNEAVMAKEVNLFVDKVGGETPAYVMIGCGNSKDYGGSRNTVTLNCDAGKQRLPDGEDPEYDVQLTGFVFEYASGNVAANVSAKEMEQWFQSGVVKKWRLAGKFDGDTVRTFDASITSFRISGSNGEAQTYSISLLIKQMPTLTTQPSA